MKKTSFLINRYLLHAPPDLCLITTDQNGTRKFFVHKIILMCISPYFQTIIQFKYNQMNKNQLCDCKINLNKSIKDKKSSLNVELNSNSNNEETPTNQLIKTCKTFKKEVDKNFLTLKLTGISDKILSFIINYAYNGKIHINQDNAQDLIVACDMYNIPAIINLTTNFFIQNLTIYNVIGIYLFAKNYNFIKLSNFSKKFILRNYEQICDLSEEFTEIPLIELLYLLEQNLLYVNDEYQVFKSIIKWILIDEEDRKQHLNQLIQRVRLALISNNKLQNQILNHKLIQSDSNVQTILKEVIRFKNYLDNYEKPNSQILNKSIKKYLTPRFPLDLVFVFGGRVLDVEFVTPEPTVEVYDHRAECWRSIQSAEDPNGPRYHHQAVVVKSNIYIIGGHCGPFNVYNSCRKFNLLTKKWSDIATMNEKRTFLTSAVLDDTIYAIGGFNGSWRVNTVERYNISLNQWQLVRSMNERRSGAGASVLNKKIYVVGGFRNLTYLRCAEFYDPLTNIWTNISLMNKPRSNPSVVTLNGFIYTIGGLVNQKLLSSAEKYDSITNSWQLLEEEMFEKKCSSTAVILDDKIYVIGGWNGIVGLRTVEIWCPQTKKWTQGPKLEKHRTGCCACLVKDIQNINEYAINEREKLIDERYKNLLE